MIKMAYICALCFMVSTANTSIASTSSIVPLSGGGNVSPSTSLNLSLSGLIPSVTYDVICYIEASYPFQYILFGSSFTDNTSTILFYSLNGRNVVQDQLIAGHNIVLIEGKFTTPSTGNITFTNLDQTNSFNVHDCFGIPTNV